MNRIQNAIPTEVVAHGLLQSMFSPFSRQTDVVEKLHWAMSALAKCLLIHRHPWHRIQERIPNLASTLTANSARRMLGFDTDAESLDTFAIFYYLGELAEAVDTLVDLGELAKSEKITRLLNTVRDVMKQRAQLRDSWSEDTFRPNATVEEKVMGLKAGLSDIGKLLTSVEPAENISELFAFLSTHIIKVHSGFIMPLYDNLKKNRKLIVELDPEFEAQSKNVHILADHALLLRVATSVVTNVAKHAHSPNMFAAPVHIDGRVGHDGGCRIRVRNLTRDKEAKDKFYRGRDYHSLSGALFKYGARYSGDLNHDEFVTGITFTTIV